MGASSQPQHDSAVTISNQQQAMTASPEKALKSVNDTELETGCHFHQDFLPFTRTRLTL